MSTFRTQKISGSVLAMLSDSDMKELGVTTMGDRRRIQHLLKSQAAFSMVCVINLHMHTLNSGFPKLHHYATS